MVDKRSVEVLGLVGNDDYRSGGHDELVDDWKVGDSYARELIEPFKGKRVRLTVEALEEKPGDGPPGPDEIDIDGVVDEKRNVRYIGKAKRRPDGTYLALANVSGALCRVEISITHAVVEEGGRNG